MLSVDWGVNGVNGKSKLPSGISYCYTSLVLAFLIPLELYYYISLSLSRSLVMSVRRSCRLLQAYNGPGASTATYYVTFRPDSNTNSYHTIRRVVNVTDDKSNSWFDTCFCPRHPEICTSLCLSLSNSHFTTHPRLHPAHTHESHSNIFFIPCSYVGLCSAGWFFFAPWNEQSHVSTGSGSLPSRSNRAAPPMAQYPVSSPVAPETIIPDG